MPIFLVGIAFFNLICIFIIKDFMNNKTKTILLIIAALLLLAGGFFIGRLTTPVKTITKTEYKELPPITDTIYYPKPQIVRPPIDTADIIAQCVADGKYYELFPEKIRDSIIYLTKEDTTAIMRDWATERQYIEKLFYIDTVGKCDFTATVQYNTITEYGYRFTPIMKTVETKEIRTKRFSPFIGIGLTTQPTIVGQAGIFFDERYGLNIMYQRDYQNKANIWGGTFMYKF